MDSIPRWLRWTVGLPLVLFLAFLLFFYFPFLNHTSVNQIGVCYDSGNGKIWTQDKPGWYVTNPLVRVSYITTLPVRVTVTSEARVIVSKMVRFKPEGLDEFNRLQGFSYFQNLENIFLGYAFSGNTYAFLEVIQEVNAENTEGLLPINRDEGK